MATEVTRFVNPASVGGDGTTTATTGANAAYASVNAALAAEFTARGATLVSNDEWLHIICQGTGADTVRVSHTSTWTTDATHYVLIEVDAAYRHAGVWSTSKFRLSGSVAAAWFLTTGIKNLRLKGLQVENTRTSGTGVVGIAVGTAGTSLDIRIEECIIRATSAVPSFTAGIDMAAGSSGAYKVANCLIYDFTNGTTGRGIRCNGNGPSYYLYNNTIVNCYQGVTNGFSAGANVLKGMLFRSNALIDVGDGANWDSMDYCATDAASFGTGTPAGTGLRTSQTFTFVNEVGDDFHLDAADAGARTFGTNLSADLDFPITADIDGTTRTGMWDIGADQVTTGGGGGGGSGAGYYLSRRRRRSPEGTMGRAVLFQKDYNSNRLIAHVWCVDATDGVTPEVSEAGGQPQISKNGAAFANTTNLLVAHDAAKGLYKLQLSTSDVDTLGTLRLVYKSANTAVFDVEFEIAPNPYLHDGTAQAGTTSTITLSTGANGTNDSAYDNAVVWIYDGTGAGQMRGVSVYVASTKVVTVDQDWTTTPDATSKYVILPSPKPVASVDFADAFLGRNILGGSSSGRTVKEALAALRNKVTLSAITGTTATLTVYSVDDATVLWSGAVTLASGTNPITGVDPA